MASFDAAINLIVNGGTKIDKIINKAAQLESIVNDINKKPLEVNVTKVTAAFDTLESNLKAAQSTLVSQQKAADQAAGSIDNYTNQIVDLQKKLAGLTPNTKKYNDLLQRQNEAIKNRAAAEREANASLERVVKTQGKIAGLEKDTGRARAAKQAAIAVENLADSYLRLGTAQQKSAGESSIASLSAQAEALKLVANNSQVASSQFNRFAIATQAASQKIFEARQKQLGALAFGLSPEAPKVNVGRSGVGSISGARNLIGSLIASGSEVVKSEAALSDYAERLRSLQSLVPYTSNEFRVLEEAIAGVNNELDEARKLASGIGLRGQKSAIQPLSGPATDLGSLKAFQLRESFQKKVSDQLNIQESIQERISQATLFDFQKKKLTLQLDEAVAALAENRLGDAQRLTREIDRQRISMERMNRAAQKPQVFGALGTAFMPVTGELPGGGLAPGSPAAKAAEAKANRESTQAAVALAKQKQKAIEDEAEELRKGTQAATALGKQKLKALQDEAERLRQETSDAVALAQQKMREEERAIAQAWKMRGGPELPPSMGGGTTGVRGQAFRAGGPGAATAALSAPRRVESLVRSTQLAQEKLLELEIRGVDVSAEKASAQKIINSLKASDLQISDQLLNNADDELNLIRDILRLEKQRLTNQRLLGGGGGTGAKSSKQSGFRAALTSEEIGAKINEIVSDFNKVVSGGDTQGVAGVAENAVDSYASRIAAGIPAVADAMAKLGGAGIKALKKALGMASPSRVMLAIAKNQVDTYVDFLKAALPVVEAAAKSLGEAGAPDVSGVPESAIRKPITEKARTRALTAEQLDRNSVIAEYAASQITGPMGQFESVKRKIEDFIDRTRTTVDLDKLFGGQESERFAMATRGTSAGPEFDKLRAALADFYQVPAELTPDLERGVKSASEASVSADELAKYVSDLTSGIEQIGALLQSAAKLPAPVVDNEFTRAQEAAAKADAIAAEAARAKAEAQKPFEASIQRAAELDAEAKRKADAAIPSVVRAQIEADAKAAADAISSSIIDPIQSAAPEGERQVRSAIGNLFDRVAGALGFGGGGGGRPPVPPTGGGAGAGAGGGAPQSIGDLQRALNLGDLAPIARATNEQLEELAKRLQIVRNQADGTSDEFVRFGKQLGALSREQERRAPDAGFLTRRLGPRGARAASEGLIGGAFPLLFGQGLGAAAGGGLGGAAGGFAGGGLGFGLSLVGTALGTALDTAVQSAIELGSALQKPIENFDQLAEKSFFSSKALEETIRKTIDYGDTATASALIQQEAIKKLGVGGVQNLKVLGTESDRLNRAFAELGQQMQAVAAGPLSSVISFFANIAGQAAAAGRVRLLRANLNEQQAGEFNKEILGRLQERGIQRGFFAPSAPTESEIGMLQDQGALQDIVDKWQAIQIKGQIKIDPKQRIESEINALQKRLEFLDIGKSLKDQFRSAAREQQDLDKQRADLVRSYEESIGNIRKQVEDEIRNKRFATLEKENQLLDAQGQIRLRQLQIANQAAVAQAGVGQRPEVEQAAKEVAQLVAQFTEQQLSAEEEAASIKRNAALDVQKIDSEAAQFKANIEKEVARLNVETARRVADINEQVRRRNEEADTRRFSIERNIAVLKLRLFQDELALATQDLSLPEQARSQAARLYRAVEKERLEVKKLNAPPALRGVGAVGGGGVSTAGLDRATADYRIAVENYVAAQLRLNELDVVKNAQEFALGIAEFANKTDATLTAIQTRESDAEIERLRYIELVNAGLTDTVAQKVIELEATKRVALAVYDTAIAQLENKIIAGDVTAEVDAQNRAYLDQIKILKERKDALEGKFGEVDTTTGKGTGAVGEAIESDRGKKIQDFIAQATAELNDLEAVAVRVSQGIGDAVGNSIANGISGLVEGTTTAKEVFADFLKDMGDILIKEGTRMIAMYVAIGIAKMFAGLFSGGDNPSGSGGNVLSGGWQEYAGGFGGGGAPGSMPFAAPSANGAYFANGVAAFANGGMFTNSVVSSPTLFQFADGGVTRTGLMGEAGPEAIMPLKRGADGKLGVAARLDGAMKRYRSTPGSAAAAAEGDAASLAAAGAATMQPIDVRYTVERINSVDYVTADQFQRGMQQAAQQGAAEGQRQTLRRLQNSPSTRRRVGV